MHDDNKITYFGQTDSRNRRVPFGIKSKDRSRHTYVIGKTGMGKSTLLENMAIQDIQNGNGIAFLDPHGKSAEFLLDYVPEERIKDVLYFAPFDLDYPVAFNVMEDVGADKRHLVANGLMSTFEKIWVDAWSARMAYILNNTILALLEFPDATLLGINRMLADKDYRKRVVENISDPAVKAFWVDEFAKYTDRFAAEATPAIQNKVGQFTSNPLIRNIIGQPKSTFDLRAMMDERKIIIVNLSKGLVGEGNANLIGSMMITKIYLAAMSRADASERELQKLPNFYLYVDEFQSFANKSFANILSEARKYKLNLTIAHQYIEQMEEEVRSAVFGNVGTMITFRVGAYDAEVLEKEFAPQFTAEDLVNLGIYQTYLKLMIDGVSSPPFSAVTLPPIEKPSMSYKKEIIDFTHSTFARPRSVVEEEIKLWHQAQSKALDGDKKPTTPRELLKQQEKETGKAKIEQPAVTKGDTPPPVRAERPAPPSEQGPSLKEQLAQILAKKEVVVLTPPPAPKKETPPPTPRPQSVTVPPAVPLQSIQPKIGAHPIEKKQKNADPKNIAALRDALSLALKATGGGTVKKDTTSAPIVPAKTTVLQSKREELRPPVPPPKPPLEVPRPKETSEPKVTSQNQPKEVPEAVLRSMLKVDPE